MRIASLVAGLIGGLGALALEIKVILDGLGEGGSGGGIAPPGMEGAWTALVLMLGLVVLIIAAGITGAFLSRKRPLAGGILMLVSGLLSLVLLPGGLYTGPFLILGSILAFISLALSGFGRTQRRARS